VQLRKLARPIALIFGVGTFAALGAWSWQALYGGVIEARFTEPWSGRPYRVFRRADHDGAKPAPVLFVLHAYATAPNLVMDGHMLKLLAVRERDFILVVPEGTRDSAGNLFWNATRACCGEGASRPDDLGYLQRVLVQVRLRYAVDPGQVLAFGVSNGGFMAHRWACSPDAQLSAIACISGAGPAPDESLCGPAPQLSVLQIHGDADDVIAYAGGQMRDAHYPSARASIGPYLRSAQLTGPPRVRRKHTLFFGAIRQEEWSSSKARIALWTVEGGGHRLRAAQASMLGILDFLQGK
jgi:polyhydroxybutyrate depolymerase